ncbi:hypothetical protein [Sorangium sp. So ce321]|uniref:magnesium chelatase subunit ChlI family protein n=1 Tax=Sorangium sp. So ce321 TaxID=3133300 RepID=UPI003F6028DB
MQRSRVAPSAESSAAVRARVVEARAAQRVSRRGSSSLRATPSSACAISRTSPMPDAAGARVLASAVERLGFAARAYTKVLRVAWSMSSSVACQSRLRTVVPVPRSPGFFWEHQDGRRLGERPVLALQLLLQLPNAPRRGPDRAQAWPARQAPPARPCPRGDGPLRSPLTVTSPA